MDAMTQLREGMRVVDADGNELGSVEDFKMGDPESVTAEGQSAERKDTLIGNFMSAFTGGPEVPEERAERLMRLGYVKIDNKGIFTGDRFVAADQVERVADDTVWLKASYRREES